MSTADSRGQVRTKRRGTVGRHIAGKSGVNGMNAKDDDELDPVLSARLPQHVWEVFDPEDLFGSSEPEYGDFWPEPAEEEP